MSSTSGSLEITPLGDADVAQAIALIQAAYAPAASSDLAQLQSLQSALLAMQRTPAAWGLIVPLLAHEDANVQFFGAHTAHAKIARGELAALTQEHQLALRDALVGLAGVPRSRVVRRKLYGALTALAVRLVPGRPGAWDGWISGTVGALAQAGAPSAHIHEFLAGAAEDLGAANMLPQPKIQLTESLRTAAPLVLQSVAAVLNGNANDPDALPAALKCLAAWLPSGVLPAADVARLVPPLIALLPTPSTSAPAAEALSDLLARPPSSWGPHTLLEPLLLWAAAAFPALYNATSYEEHNNTANASELRRYTKLLVALGDAGVEWVAAHLVDGRTVEAGAPYTRAQVAQGFLRVMLKLTALDPGGARLPSTFGSSSASASSFTSPSSSSGFPSAPSTPHLDEDADEDEDEDAPDAGAPLGFWYLLQEALWEVPAAFDATYPSSSYPSSSSSSYSGFAPSTPGYPSTPSGAKTPDYAGMTDAEMGRGRGGAGGTPWTPGGIASSSFASPLSSVAPPFGTRDSFGFPPTSSQPGDDDGDEGQDAQEEAASEARTGHARAAYGALVRVLRAKVVYPRVASSSASHSGANGGGTPGAGGQGEMGGGQGGREGWSAERLERFGVYRRDVGDTLVNAYYILRADLLAFYVSDVLARLEGEQWEEIEATLHCLRAVHEALDTDATDASDALARLFGEGVWGRLPVGGASGGGGGGGMDIGQTRLRRTALGLVDTYAAYFTARAPDALLPPLRYVLGALADADRGVCLQAALALRSLCDANRRALAGRIGAFAEVHAGLAGVPDSEKGKVLQSIASVIQALPPAEAVAPIEAMVGPILERLGAALGAVEAHPEAARLAAILQLEILAGVAKGLTRTADPLAFDEDESGGAEADAVRAAREDPRTGALRGALFDAIARVAELWSADAEVGQALSELFKAITALPADVTLLSLPAQPLLGVVCRAARRRLNAVWLALATILIAQLNPPPLLLTIKSGPTEEAEAAVRAAVGEIVSAALAVLGAPGGMVENPDIVQEFFACMDRVAQDFTGSFCALPDGAFDALMQCAISGLTLQERYSLVAACTFLGTLIHRTALYAPLAPTLLPQLQAHMIRVHGRAIMRAVLSGFAGAAPRSVTANLLELLGALVSRWDERAVAEAEQQEGGMEIGERERGGAQGGARAWVAGVVLADDFFPSKAGREAKERFVKTVVSSRSVKKTKEAANQFLLVAWGLEGSTFGYSSATAV
ncbi:hypothetical protein C8R44DRAFT_991404 [Mycena epipterygia]|nr:hypothetical protein C8R44DRAFT_991404 [Mycena epipterygia]